MRVVHLTFYKCASQWVRDILTDPEVSAVTGFPLSLNSVDVAASPWPEQPCNTFAGPVYGASAPAWLANSRPDDRAIVVIRDPRDIVVSLMYSVAFNHAPTINTLLLRSPMEGASTKDRVRLGMHLITGWADALKSWGGFQLTGREFLTSYKSITEDPAGQFERILNFVGWQVPPDVFSRVLDRFSFEKMTGRKRGESNVFSHHRKGIDGDWRNYFDRQLGYEFEETFPGMLASLGFEPANDWFEALPQDLETLREDAVPESDARKLLVRIAELEHLHQEVIDVEFWRKAAEERLGDIERLTKTVERLRANFAERKQVAEERLADIVKLNEVVKELDARIEKTGRIADERLEQIGALTELVHNLEAKLAEPNYLAEERLAKMLELTGIIGHLEERASAAEQNALERYEQVEELNKAVHAAQDQAQRRLGDIERLTDIVHAAEAAAQARLRQVKELHTTLAESRADLADAQDTAEQRLADINRLTAAIRTLEGESAKRLRMVEELTATIEDLHIRADAANRTAEELHTNLAKSRADLADAQDTAEQRLSDINRLTAAIRTLEGESAKRLRMVEELTAAIEDLRIRADGADRTAEERLASLNAMNEIVVQRQQVIEGLSTAAEERLADIHKLTAMVHEAQATADERLDALERLTLQHRLLQENFDRAQIAAIDHAAQVRELEASFSYRYGFRPIAALGGMLRRVTRAQKPRFAQNRGV